MTDLEIKAIQHCVDQLKQVETYKIYSWLWSNGHISGTDDEKKAFFKTLESKLSENVNTHVSDAKDWLTTLLKK